MIRITIRGKQYEMDRENIIKAMKDKEPKPIRSYYVEVEGVGYPIKQVAQSVLNIHPIAFTSMDAYRLLDKLGFEIHSVED